MHSGDHAVHTKCSQEWTQLILLSVALHLTPKSPDFPNHNNNLAFIPRLWVKASEWSKCTPFVLYFEISNFSYLSWICCQFSQEWKPEGRSRETSHPFKLIIMSLRPRPSHPAYWPIVFVFLWSCFWCCVCVFCLCFCFCGCDCVYVCLCLCHGFQPRTSHPAYWPSDDDDDRHYLNTHNWEKGVKIVFLCGASVA